MSKKTDKEKDPMLLISYQGGDGSELKARLKRRALKAVISLATTAIVAAVAWLKS